MTEMEKLDFEEEQIENQEPELELEQEMDEPEDWENNIVYVRSNGVVSVVNVPDDIDDISTGEVV